MTGPPSPVLKTTIVPKSLCPVYPSTHSGPTPYSNWVIPGHLIAGGFPASCTDDALTTNLLTAILQAGTTTFVCLQSEFDLNTPESAWRNKQGLRVYLNDCSKLMSRNKNIKQKKVDFLHLKIDDGRTAPDAAIDSLAIDCCERLLRGEVMYIHCWGGHGRTGTLISLILSKLYGLNAEEAMQYTQASHDARVYPQGVPSPHTSPQRAQVRRMLADQPSLGGILTGKSRSNSDSSRIPAEASSWALHRQYNGSDSIEKWQTHLKQASNWTDLDISGNINNKNANSRINSPSQKLRAAAAAAAADITNTNIILKHATPSPPIKSPTPSSSSSSSSVLMTRSRTTSLSSQELIRAAVPPSNNNNNSGTGGGRRPVTDAYNHNDTRSSLTILPLLLKTPPKPSFGNSNSGNGRGGGGGETPEDRAKRRTDYLAQIMKEQNMVTTLKP
jgi:hypothetical protein